MTVSTDGEISYGILFEEGFEFPWDEYEDGLDGDWWRIVNGYVPPFEIFKDGEYIGGKKPSEEKMALYDAAQKAFDDAHPLPIELVNVQSGQYPAYIIAVKGTVLTAWRGFPQAFNPIDLVITDEQRNTLIEFCKAYDIDIGDSEPRWYLSSYWG